MTGVGAVLAGVEDTSYSINNDTNALAATNIGRKRIELLLGGGFIMPFHRGGKWIEKLYPSDTDYKDYRPWETLLSIRFAPGSDQTINGFVVGGGYRITKYFSLLVGYSATPMDEPSPGFRLAASQIVANNPNVFPYSRYNASDLLANRVGSLRWLSSFHLQREWSNDAKTLSYQPDHNALPQRDLFWREHSFEPDFLVQAGQAVKALRCRLVERAARLSLCPASFYAPQALIAARAREPVLPNH